MVAEALRAIGLNLRVVDASERFFNATTKEGKGADAKDSLPLKSLCAPETKRRIIGDTFMHVTEQAVKDWNLPENIFLAQGTLRPDLIESASHLASTGGNAEVIKTHHNDTALVRELRTKGRIVEPLKDYHKDEVRKLGLELGLPPALIWRQPFPGPGLAIRIICAPTPFTTPDDEKIVGLLREWNTENVSATLLPCRTVGVQGDCRSYSAAVGLTVTGTPDWPRLIEIAKEIPKKVHGVNRVVFIFGDRIRKDRETSITPTFLTPEVITQLQNADHIVGQGLIKYNLVNKLSQVPVILFPVDFGVAGARGVCIRTFLTNDFMTGVPAIPGREIPIEALEEMVTGILRNVPGIARVAFDLTAKPPGTTEWE